MAPPETAKLYRSQFGPDRLQGVEVVRDLAFGTDPKQLLNVYKPAGGGAGRRY